MKDGGIYLSFWGIWGSEDIGGGYKINFKLQGLFDSSIGKLQLSDMLGVVVIFNQVVLFGVLGLFGMFMVGCQIVLMIYVMVDIDVCNVQFFGSVLIVWFGLNMVVGWLGMSINGVIGVLYDSNVFVYQLLMFVGVLIVFEYVLGGVVGQFQGGMCELVVFRYVNDGLNLLVVYYNGYDMNLVLGVVLIGVDNNCFVYVGVKYMICDFLVLVLYGNGWNLLYVDKVNFDMLLVGVGYCFMFVLQVMFVMYYLKDCNCFENCLMVVVFVVDYSLLKWMMVYVQVGYVNNCGMMDQMFVYGQLVVLGVGIMVVMVGLWYNF